MEGFEPPNARTKTWCLTTWPHPNINLKYIYILTSVDGFVPDIETRTILLYSLCSDRPGALPLGDRPNINLKYIYILTSVDGFVPDIETRTILLYSLCSDRPGALPLGDRPNINLKNIYILTSVDGSGLILYLCKHY
jgi:hypothetical protein